MLSSLDRIVLGDSTICLTVRSGQRRVLEHLISSAPFHGCDKLVKARKAQHELVPPFVELVWNRFPKALNHTVTTDV